MKEEEAARWGRGARLPEGTRECHTGGSTRGTLGRVLEMDGCIHRRALARRLVALDPDNHRGLGGQMRVRRQARPEDREARQREPQPPGDVMREAAHEPQPDHERADVKRWKGEAIAAMLRECRVPHRFAVKPLGAGT